MSPVHTATTTQVRTELLGRLGLPAGTQDDALEDAHRRLGEFLDGAPQELRGWADKKQAEADRLYGLLTGPDAELAGLAAARSTAARQAAAPIRRSFPVWGKWLAGIAVVAAVIFGVYQIGKPPSDLPAMTAAEGASATPAAQGLDQAKVAELMGKLQANPQDLTTLHGLADVYYAAGDYKQAADWLQKVLDIDPTNEQALVAIGATSFNQGDLTKAEEVWNQAAQLYPANPEVFYDLGFLYMTTQRTDEMKAAWDKVVEIAPDSVFAETVKSHVGSVKPEALPSAAPTPETKG